MKHEKHKHKHHMEAFLVTKPVMNNYTEMKFTVV